MRGMFKVELLTHGKPNMAIISIPPHPFEMPSSTSVPLSETLLLSLQNCYVESHLELHHHSLLMFINFYPNRGLQYSPPPPEPEALYMPGKSLTLASTPVASFSLG